jgi:hypothetical protein
MRELLKILSDHFSDVCLWHDEAETCRIRKMVNDELAKPEPQEWPCRMIAADFETKTATIEFESSDFKAFAGKYKLVMMK